MILILNDTAHCWENETSVAASHFECPCEFIKSTSFLVPTRICTAAPVWKNIQGQKYLMWCRMPYQGLCSALQFMTVSLPKYLLCARPFFSFFLLDISFKAFPLWRWHRAEKGEEMLLLCRLLSTPDVAFQGVWHRSYPSEQPRCPTEKIFAVFLKNKLEWGFYNWH